MKNFEILWELPKCDTETQSKQMLLKNNADRFAWCGVAINLRFVKKNKTKQKKTKKNIVKHKEAKQ